MQYTYSYKMQLPRHIERVGQTLTGSVTVGREYSDEEVVSLAKEMFHGTVNDAELVEVRLVSQRLRQ